MNSEDEKVLAAFAERLNEVCDDMHLPRERGRQTALAAVFQVTNKASRKWLLGLGLPELTTILRIADWAKVSALWLLQGVGEKSIQPAQGRVETKALVLDEAIRTLPKESGIDLIDNLRAKLERVGRLPARGEPLTKKYKTMLDAYERELGGKSH